MKKFLVTAIFGLAGLAAFAGTCAITHISLVSTDASHDTFAGQLDNTSGANILQHNFVVAFLDVNNNVVETTSVSGCLRSVQNNSTDFFSATSIASASSISTGLARIAFDSAFKVGTTSPQNVSMTNVTASRTTTTPATLTVAGTLTNNSGTTLYSPNVCVVVRTSLGNVLITGTTSTVDLASSATATFSRTITVPNDSTASTVDIWVDGLDASSNPTTPQSNTGFTITTGGVANRLAFSTQPAGGVVVNMPFATTVVEILDTNGVLVSTGSGSSLVVTLSLVTGTVPASEVSPAPALACDANGVLAVGGFATFTNCQVNHAGQSIQLTATAAGVTSVNSSSFGILPGTATMLGFGTQPSGAVANSAFTTQPAVLVQDDIGDTVWTGTDSDATVTLVASGGTLSCTPNPLAASAGVATFTGCKIVESNPSVTLTASAPGLTSSPPSTAFAITAAPQTITFGAIANHPSTDFALTLPTPTASSGLVVTLSSTTPGVCTVAGYVVTRVSAGTCSLTASQPGDATYAAATDVVESFTVTS